MIHRSTGRPCNHISGFHLPERAQREKKTEKHPKEEADLTDLQNRDLWEPPRALAGREQQSKNDTACRAPHLFGSVGERRWNRVEAAAAVSGRPTDYPSVRKCLTDPSYYMFDPTWRRGEHEKPELELQFLPSRAPPRSPPVRVKNPGTGRLLAHQIVQTPRAFAAGGQADR